MSTPTPRPALKATGVRRRDARCPEAELATLTTERDRLRAEVERLSAIGSWAHTCIHHTDEERKAWVACPCCAIARAERAEKAEIALAEIDSIIWASLSEKEWYDEKHDIIDIIEDWKKQKQRH